MVNTPEKIVILDADPHSREDTRLALQLAGYDVAVFATTREGLDAIHQGGADLLLLDAAMQEPSASEVLATIRGAAKTAGIRVLLLVAAGSEQRASALDLGADDAISRPGDTRELLARVRARLRIQRAENELREKMPSDAFSLDRKLKTGFAAVLAVAIVMAGIYFLFAHSAQKVTQRSNAMLARLEGGIVRQQDLIAEARKLRAEQGNLSGAVSADPAAKNDLKRQAEDLKAKMATASSDDAAGLQKQLQETNFRLKRLEAEGQAAQSIIPLDVQSVCLLHVAVAFNDQQSGRRLRYGGLNEDGEPIQDSEGNPVLTLEGTGPEVKMDVFGTGFVAGPNGRVITNRHVAEPWWKNDEIKSITSQGLQPQISAIRAYFPGDPRDFHAEIQDISDVTDLASVRVDLQ